MARTELPERLETERLVLRVRTVADAEDIFDYASRPEVSYPAGFPPVKTLEDEIYYLEHILPERNEKDNLPAGYGIVAKGTDKVIGSVDFNHRHENDVLEIGYTLHPDYWGRGYVPEAARALIDLAFKELGLHKIELTCFGYNVQSQRVAEKLGFTLEARIRDRKDVQGNRCDSLIYGLLRSEWEVYLNNFKIFRDSKLFDSVLTETVLKKLGLSSKDKLIFDNGSFHIQKKFRLNIISEGLDFDQSVEIERDSKKFLLPMGCRVLLTNDFLAKQPRPKEFPRKVTPVGWDSQLNRCDTYINRGHIIAHELYPDPNWKFDKDRKYFTQTEWSNKSSKSTKEGNLKVGKNLAYYESEIKRFLNENNNSQVLYYVKLIYSDDDLIPRGIVLKAIFKKKIDKYSNFVTIKSLHVFIPNIDSRLKIDYKNAIFTILE